MNPIQPIAIVGMGAVFPGALNPTAYWHNIVHKVNQTAEIAPERWICAPELMVSEDYQADKARHNRACLIHDFTFDPGGLAVDPELLLALDPLYHLVLEAGRQALADYVPTDSERLRTGVVLAAIALPTDASSHLARRIFGAALESRIRTVRQAPLTSKEAWAARVTGLPGALLARCFELGAGSLTLDAACASSLYALKIACDTLQGHRADVMLAGGVSRPDCLYTQTGFSQLQALSPRGRCAPFDRSADGLVVGEGAGVLVLKRLADARRDHNPIYGLIHAIGLSNDRRGALLAPDQEGQQRAMQAAYTAAGWVPEDVDLIECHGAGTPLGDATELASLRQLWQNRPWRAQQCAIGSVKSMIGHLLTAAGSAGLIKLLLALKHRILPPSLHFAEPVVGSPLENSPFYVPTEAQPWPDPSVPGPRRAALSAFGFGGINAHLLLEAWEGESGKNGGRPGAHRDRSLATISDGAEGNSGREPSGVSEDAMAIVGMAASVGGLGDLEALRRAIFAGKAVVSKRPAARWKGVSRDLLEALGGSGLFGLKGAFLEEVTLAPGELRIPPNEIPDILPQHLLMLKTARQAMLDAGPLPDAAAVRSGVIIAMDFDYEATDYHLRWQTPAQVREWEVQEDLKLNPQAASILADSFGAPLTAVRTQGALGGLIASRVAREFKCGGPAFNVSGDATGGLQALALAADWLQQGLVHSMLVGAVDLTGDLRQILMQHRLAGYASKGLCAPFDRRSQGQLPAEGGVALVLKTLKQARQDGNRVYAVITGQGQAHGGGFDQGLPTSEAYMRSFTQALGGSSPRHLGYIEAHGSGCPDEDAMEAACLARLFESREDLKKDEARNGTASQTSVAAVGALKGLCGHAGAAAGLLGVVKTALCLQQTLLPPLVHTTSGKSEEEGGRSEEEGGRSEEEGGRSEEEGGRRNITQTLSSLLTPHSSLLTPKYWAHSPSQGPRRAAVAALSRDGNCSHVVLAEAPSDCDRATARIAFGNLTASAPVLLAVYGSDTQSLAHRLNELETVLESSRTTGASLSRAAAQWQQQHHDSGRSEEGGGRKEEGGRRKGENTTNRLLTPHSSLLTLTPEAAAPLAAALWASDRDGLQHAMGLLRDALNHGRALSSGGAQGAVFTPQPLAHKGQLAFVYPGSGNHYVGMGRSLGLYWPGLMRELERETPQLKEHLLPHLFSSWEPRGGFQTRPEAETLAAMHFRPLDLIFGQVLYGTLMTRLMRHLQVEPQAALGYSLGESAALFALNIWPDRQGMHQRLLNSTLFTEDLAGPCRALRQAWQIPHTQALDWRVMLLNRSAAEVRPVLDRYAHTRLLIVNTPDECVVGGLAHQVDALIADLRCDAFPLEGVVTVHCDALAPVKAAYREMHHFTDTTPSDLRIYSSAWQRAYSLNADRCADAITDQALHGFDFNAVVQQAWQDGVRLFVEVGPQASCTRMIRGILQDRPHRSLSLSHKDENHYTTLMRGLAILISERVAVDTGPLFEDRWKGGNGKRDVLTVQDSERAAGSVSIMAGQGGGAAIVRRVGGLLQFPEIHTLMQTAPRRPPLTPSPTPFEMQPETSSHRQSGPLPSATPPGAEKANASILPTFTRGQRDIMARWRRNTAVVAASHQDYLRFSLQNTQALTHHLLQQARLLAAVAPPAAPPLSPGLAFTRAQCLEFARGRASKVLGPDFDVVDSFAVRVRLPDEPLMLVDRILSVEGHRGVPGPGRIVTEHDVKTGAWYLDGGHAPVCISVEAGQADLFLSAWLGIDLQVQGARAYRLLDATVMFHRDLPRPGETIRYDIRIERFVRQGPTWMFFFNFDGTIGSERLISMRNGCAGFFTPAEVAASGGIIRTAEDTRPQPGQRPEDWQPLVDFGAQTNFDRLYTEQALPALRAGDLATAFGSEFRGLTLAPSLRLPDGRLRLIDRVIEIHPDGGRYGLGRIVAEADIDPEDWFLTCHFVDDMVMPGTLMYECCAHALRVLLQRLGWVWPHAGTHYAPVQGVASVLKCRGPVTPATRHVRYEIELKSLDYRPEPTALADALMRADGHPIVFFKDLSLRLVGLTRRDLETFWKKRKDRVRLEEPETESGKSQVATAQNSNMATDFGPMARNPLPDGVEADRPEAAPLSSATPAALYAYPQILAFATGKPSEAFGEPYRVFDQSRRIARLPGPPYLFLDCILAVDQPPWKLAPGGWAHARYNVKPQSWYFEADRSGIMPYCVMLEIPLQLCGWLAAYAGSALKSPQDLKFRNLGGQATIFQDILPSLQDQTLDVLARLTKVSVAGDSIIESFDFKLKSAATVVFEGHTTFGFFTSEALARQVGLRQAHAPAWQPSASDLADIEPQSLPRLDPQTPQDCTGGPLPFAAGLQLPGRALCLLDGLDGWLPEGGPHGLGYLRGHKQVDPREWFFKAHFYQDPVCPGSLGLESFLQLVKYAAIQRWGSCLMRGRQPTHRFSLVCGQPQEWVYRGQIIPTSQRIEVEAMIRHIEDGPEPLIMADGFLKVDGLYIYAMKEYGLKLVQA